MAAIIHLSDLECGEHNRAANRIGVVKSYKKCADRIIEDIKNELYVIRRIPSSQVGLILTGDITNTGSKGEFDCAGEMLQHIISSLGINKTHVAIVPGNHDVNWDLCKEAFQQKFPRLRIDISHQREKARDLVEKLEHYQTFLKELLGYNFTGPECVIAYDGFIDIGLAVIGFDTTYHCTFVPEDNQGILRDDPVLVMGKNVLGELLLRRENLVPIAIMHHCPLPLQNDSVKDTSYLQNATEAINYLQNAGFKLVFAGHEHTSRTDWDILSGLHIFVTGSYGLNAQRLLIRYHGNYKLGYNKYQIFLVQDNKTGEIVYRKLTPPGDFDSNWEADKYGSGSIALTLGSLTPRGDLEGTLSENVVAKIDSGVHLLSDGTIAFSVRLAGGKKILDKIASVTYKAGEVTRTTAASHLNFLADMAISKDSGGKIEGVVSCKDGSTTFLTLSLPQHS
jgi:hypothetical protein